MNESDEIIVKIAGKYEQLNLSTHIINCGDGKRLFDGFDVYSDHSCEPNSKVSSMNDLDYQVIVLKHICEGDSITCDYTIIDLLMLDGTVFDCNCGSAICKGKIYA